MRRRRRSEVGPGRDHGRAWRGVWLWPPLSLRTRLSETQESKLRCKHAAPAWSLRGRGLCGRGGADAPGAPHSWRSLPGTSGQHVAPITVPKACARAAIFTHRMAGVGVGGVSFRHQTAGGAQAGRVLPSAGIPESSCAPEGPGAPAFEFEPRPLPGGHTVHSVGLTGTHLKPDTNSTAPLRHTWLHWS